jgi:hypothetical protein
MIMIIRLISRRENDTICMMPHERYTRANGVNGLVVYGTLLQPGDYYLHMRNAFDEAKMLHYYN